MENWWSRNGSIPSRNKEEESIWRSVTDRQTNRQSQRQKNSRLLAGTESTSEKWRTYIVLLSSLTDHELTDSCRTELHDVAEYVNGCWLYLNIIHRLYITHHSVALLHLNTLQCLIHYCVIHFIIYRQCTCPTDGTLCNNGLNTSQLSIPVPLYQDQPTSPRLIEVSLLSASQLACHWDLKQYEEHTINRL